jgi:hypothetical protein
VFNFRVAVKGSLPLDLNKEFIKNNVEINSPDSQDTKMNWIVLTFALKQPEETGKKFSSTVI